MVISAIWLFIVSLHLPLNPKSQLQSGQGWTVYDCSYIPCGSWKRLAIWCNETKKIVILNLCKNAKYLNPISQWKHHDLPMERGSLSLSLSPSSMRQRRWSPSHHTVQSHLQVPPNNALPNSQHQEHMNEPEVKTYIFQILRQRLKGQVMCCCLFIRLSHVRHRTALVTHDDMYNECAWQEWKEVEVKGGAWKYKETLHDMEYILLQKKKKKELL
jgi:hypothetical protein